MRYVCQFSCGAASAVATKLTLAAPSSAREILIVNAFIEQEHPDNRRFLGDCESWFGHPITVLRDAKYAASTYEVWRRKRFMKGMRGAPCSMELKRRLLTSISEPGDVNVIGFTREEHDRFDDLRERFPDERFEAPLIDRNLSKGDCLAMLERAGIGLPAMYRLGYANANCIGCPKGGQSYWQAIREDFPQQFQQIKAIQEEIGPGASFLRFRSGPRANDRMSLAELPVGRGSMDRGERFSCSFFCDLAEQEFKGAEEGATR